MKEARSFYSRMSFVFIIRSTALFRYSKASTIPGTPPSILKNQSKLKIILMTLLI
ncbi:hypothetical protein H8E88_27580 [candidate division KSB1 bacterium]|nr:hypothetical protein [candidate division KSB1 bacterium]